MSNPERPRTDDPPGPPEPDPAARWDALPAAQRAALFAGWVGKWLPEYAPQELGLYALYPWEWELLKEARRQAELRFAVDMAGLAHREEPARIREADSSFLAGVADWEAGYAPEPAVLPEDGYGAGFPKSRPDDDAY